MQDQTAPVLVQRDGPVGIITINRPEKRNAINNAVQNGLSTRTVPFGAVSDAEIAALDVDNVAAVCICHVDAGANGASLRRVIRRLRPHLPKDFPVAAGMWRRPS